MGDWSAETSDIDIAAVCNSRLTAEQRGEVVAALSHAALRCPARVLELVVYRRDEVAAPRLGMEFELNLNTGPLLNEHVCFDSGEEPNHWFAIDLAIARVHGIPLYGPRPELLIGTIGEQPLRAALIESLRWHDAHEPASANSVLNACRAWRYTVEHIWSSKSDAARWALEREADAALLRAALDSRRRASASLAVRPCRAFLAQVAAILAGGDPALA
jgi:Domain of unknown function (DUF4111)